MRSAQIITPKLIGISLCNKPGPRLCQCSLHGRLLTVGSQRLNGHRRGHYRIAIECHHPLTV